MRLNIKYLLISIISVALTAIIGSFFTSKNMVSWYYNLNLPSIVPPGFIFPIAWSILYVLMIITFYLIFISGGNKRQIGCLRKQLIYLFYLQLFLNFFWVIIFFELHLLLIGLIEIVILEIILITIAIKAYKLNKAITYLIIPYILWIAFATVLNLVVLLAN